MVEVMQRIFLVFLFLVVKALGQHDFEALLELKKGIENDSSRQVLVSWDSKSLSSDGCPKNWYGVTCNDGFVTAINLDDLGLAGYFSFPAIVSLRLLQNLSISGNHLTGTISKIGSFQSLRFLDLSRNMFHGLIPPGISNLKNLGVLNISSNNFEGLVPSGFGNVEQLKYLDLRANGLSGDVMHLLSQLGGVWHVDLSSNHFSGSLDLALGNSSFVSSIQYLNISHNSLVGNLFAHDGMPFFDSLEVFDASDNQLVGTIPSFNFIVSLQILRLGGNHLSGSLPEALLQESSMILSELDLSLNQLEGPVGSITSATLKKLNLSSNKLSGSLPLKIGHCAIIDLSNNMLSGNLSRIQAWGNYVEVIQLSSNSLTGTLSNQTSQFLRLTSFRVSNNSLHGELPRVLGTYPELEVIDLSLNQLSGLLIPSFFTSTKLTYLNLYGNNFTGTIPLHEIQNSIGTTQNLSLVTLDLSYNSLSGHLPEEIGRFHDLVYLNLSNNKFEGNIPNVFPDELRGFNVSFNNLSGVVPDNLRQFPDSAFHPGNSLLIFPYSPSTLTEAPDLNLRKRSTHVKPAIVVALIAGLVGAAALIALFCVILYYRASWWKFGKDSLEGNVGKKSVQHGDSPLSHASRSNKNVDPSLSSLSFCQDLLSSAQLTSGYESGDTSSGVKKLNNLQHPESMRKSEVSSPPISFLSSTNPSPSKSQLSSDNLGGLSVCSPDKLAGDLHLFDGSVVFTAEELSCAPAESIGRSCHGTLYRAQLNCGYVLAVKWLREGIAKHRKDFAREVKKLGSIKHSNLVSLLGYYWGPLEHEKLIISDYIDAQCLAFYLQETQLGKLPPLSLDQRLRIAIDVARCLSYLHNERAIPHGNLKSTNILLQTPDLTVRLTDYSLHRILTPTGTSEQVLNAGALGYRPPEFASSRKPCPSLKSDVYAYGVILLELLTGKSPGDIVSGDAGVVELTDWVKLLAEEGRSVECLDRLILDGNNMHHAPRVLNDMLQVALRCILPALERPDMKSVFEDLLMIML